ncbi:MAG: hypothetical protein RL684_2083 [Pseudomonadota bacterium]
MAPMAAIMQPTPAFAADAAVTPGLTRVTTSFDVRHAAAVLRAASRPLASGFSRADAERVSHDIDSLKADQPKVWHFDVHYQGKAQPLEIRALLDDLGMIDLDFATSAELAPVLRGAVDAYLNSRGR